MVFKSQVISALLSLTLFLAAGDIAQAKPSLETRSPSETKELDRDENGTPDAYWEKYNLDDGLTIETHDRLEENSGKLQGRVTYIKVHDKFVWTETYLPSLRERDVSVERHSPFRLSTTFHGKSGKATVTLVGDKASLVTVLVREKGGRLSPITDEELERLNNLGQAVSEFTQGILDDSEELEDSKAKADEHLRRLDDAVTEYTQSGSEQANGPTEPENEAK
jgi:hypothetical protein